MKSKTHSRRKGRVNIGASEPGGVATERDIAANVPQAPRFVPSLVELAQVLGVCRQTLTRWHREPGAPGKRSDGRYEVAPWQTFLRNRPAFGGGPEAYAARCQNIRLQCQRLEFEIAQLQRHYVKASDVEQWSKELCGTITGIVRGSLTKLAPEVRLCSVVDAESKLKEAEDSILTRLHKMANG